MAAIDEKISDLTSLTQAVGVDLIPIVDVNEDKTKNIRKDFLFGTPGPIGSVVHSTGKFTTIELNSGATIGEFSTDGTLLGNSNSVVPTERAVKTYVNANIVDTPPHNDLTGLQGGDSTSEYYHFDLQTHDQIGSTPTEVTFSRGVDIDGNVTINSSDTTALVVVGDIHCNDLFTSGSTINVGTGQMKSTAGNIELYHDDVKKFETTSDGVSVTGDLTLDGTTGIFAHDISYNKIEGATYNRAQEVMDVLGSSGVISGGTISEDSTSQISVTSGTGLIRTSNSDIAPIVFIDWPGVSVNMPENADKTIVVKYNGGSPAVFAEDPVNVNLNNMIILGEVETVEGELHFANTRQRAGDFNAKLLERMYETQAVARVDGMILGESADGNRYVTMTEGNVWALLEKDVIAAIDTETGDEFTEYWEDGGVGWNTSPDHTVWNMTQYDDESGNLATLSNGRYTSRWFYLVPADNSLHMVYGVANEKDLAKASDEPAPSDLPTILGEHSVLLGRLLIQKDVTIASEVQTAFETSFDLSPATNHSNLANLIAPADDHTQYSLVSGARDFTGTVGGIDPLSATDFVTLDYMSKLGTDRQRLIYDGTTNLDISVEHIVDVKYVDFLDNEDAPPWQEGRVFWDKNNNTFGVYNDVPDVTLQVGQETHIKIRNESGSLIPNGAICYVVGASQGRALVLLAIATSEVTSEGIVVVTHDLDNNTDGYGTIIGMVRDIDVNGISEGDEIYLSANVEGGFTNVRPGAPNYVIDLGNVITTDGTMGDILVQILNHGDFRSLADVSLVDTPTNGETLVYDGANDFWIAESQPKVVSYTLPLSGVTDTQVPLTGSFIVKDTGQTGDVTADFAVSNQHLWFLINSVTLADSTGTIIITGTSLSEETAVPVIGDTEVITIDSTAETSYQSDKKWWDITNIDISADISAIDYDYGIVGYPDFGNRSFKILGYRMDAFSSGVSPDMRLIFTKVNDLGDKKVEFIELEDIGVDSGAAGDQIIDHIRSGVDDRSYNPAVTDIWLNNETLTFKQLDFDEYFTNDENHINAATGNEGIFIRIEGEPPGGGITNVDFITLIIFFAII